MTSFFVLRSFTNHQSQTTSHLSVHPPHLCGKLSVFLTSLLHLFAPFHESSLRALYVPSVLSVVSFALRFSPITSHHSPITSPNPYRTNLHPISLVLNPFGPLYQKTPGVPPTGVSQCF